MNSRDKGKRGEREWRDELRANGYQARRGQQFSGSPDSPDVVCEELDWIHFEVKAVERLNIEDAMEQARRDCGLRIADCGMQKVPVVAHRRSYRRWLVTMDAETFFNFLRGMVPQNSGVEGRVSSDERQKNRTNGANDGAKGTEDSGATPEPTRETRVLPTTNQDKECRALTSAATTKDQNV